MATIQVGAEDPSLVTAEQDLASAGSQLLQTELATAMPWTALPVVSLLVGYICSYVSNWIITNINQAAYAVYVAAKTGKQVSDFISTQQSGPSSASDASGDALINLGNE